MDQVIERVKGARSPDEFDIQVADRVRQERVRQGRTLQDVSARMGISHQQLQKYETGTNRMSLGMYKAVCETLGVPMDYFLKEDHTAQDRLPYRVANDLTKLHTHLGTVLEKYKSQD